MGFFYREPGGESPSRKTFLVVSSVVFSFLTSGVIFGFSGLYDGLLNAGAFSDLCPADEPPPCQIQHDRLTLMYTISASTISGIALPVGIFLDHFGPRLTVCIGALIFASGLGSLALANLINDLLYYLGFFFLAVGGPCIFNSVISFGELFGERSAAVIGAQTGAFNASSVVLFLIGQAIAFWPHISLQRIMCLYMIVPAIVFLVSLFMYPDRPFDSQKGALGQGETYRTWLIRRTLLLNKLHRNAAYDAISPGDGNMSSNVEHYGTPRSSDVQRANALWFAEEGGATPPPTRTGSLREPLLAGKAKGLSSPSGSPSVLQSPLSPAEQRQLHDPAPRIYNVDFADQVRSPVFWTMTVVTASLVLRINFYIATVYRQMYLGVISRQHPPGSDPAAANRIAGEYTSIFNIVLPLGGVVMVPLVGYVLVNFGLVFSFAAIGVMNLIFCIVNLLEYLPHKFQLLGYVAFGATRPFVFSVMAAYIGRIFGFKNFGKLYGLCRVGGSFATSLSYPLVTMSERYFNHEYSYVNWAFLFIGVLILLLFPIYLQSFVFAGFWLRPDSLRGVDVVQADQLAVTDSIHEGVEEPQTETRGTGNA